MPTIHARTAAAVPTLCVRPIATIGMLDRMDPKIGTRDITAATSDRMGQYFRPKIQKPTAESSPFTRQMINCPRTTPDKPQSIRASSSSKRLRSARGTSVRKKSITRSRVIIRYAASMSVMKKTKMPRLTAETIARPMRMSSSVFFWP